MLNYSPEINFINYKEHRIGILRLDLIHPEVSGNKWFKLKYNIEQAQRENKKNILTFGGAYSNHIAATAAACRLFGLKSIGIIRGDELPEKNTTLVAAEQQGMRLHFVNRTSYREKDSEQFYDYIQKKFPDSYIIPEGGNNALGELGCRDILSSDTSAFKHIFCATGTGATLRGMAQSLNKGQILYGVNVLKFDAEPVSSQTKMLNNYHFGGYAKHTQELLDFKNWFETTYHILLDYVYTAKSFFAAFKELENLSSSEPVLIIHCGGLQGNEGYEKRYNLNPNRQVNDAHG